MPKSIGVVWIRTTVRRWVTYSQGCLAFFLFEFLGAVTCSLEDQLSDRVCAPVILFKPKRIAFGRVTPKDWTPGRKMRLAMPQLPCAEQHPSRALTAIPSGMRRILVDLRTAREPTAPLRRTSGSIDNRLEPDDIVGLVLAADKICLQAG